MILTKTHFGKDRASLDAFRFTRGSRSEGAAAVHRVIIFISMRKKLMMASALAVTPLFGCAVHYSSRVESPAGSAQVSVSSGTPIGNAILIGIMAADAVETYRSSPEGANARRAPPPDPTRKINVQDCTQPIDFLAGNLRCR